MADDIQARAGESGMLLPSIAIEHASSMVLGEQVHHPVGRTFKRLHLENTHATDEILLDVDCKDHKNSSGFRGLVHTVLVFGTSSWPPVNI